PLLRGVQRRARGFTARPHRVLHRRAVTGRHFFAPPWIQHEIVLRSSVESGGSGGGGVRRCEAGRLIVFFVFGALTRAYVVSDGFGFCPLGWWQPVQFAARMGAMSFV